jgi:hypothetical protein
VGVRRAWLGWVETTGLNREGRKKTDKDSDDAVSGKRRGGRWWAAPSSGARAVRRCEGILGISREGAVNGRSSCQLDDGNGRSLAVRSCLAAHGPRLTVTVQVLVVVFALDCYRRCHVSNVLLRTLKFLFVTVGVTCRVSRR